METKTTAKLFFKAGKHSLNIYLSKFITLTLRRCFETAETPTNQQMSEGSKWYLKHSVYRGINPSSETPLPYFMPSLFLHQEKQFCL